MVDAEIIRYTIEQIGKSKMGESFELSEVAKEISFANWEELMEPVQLVADVMVQQGKLELKGSEITYLGSHSR